MADLTIREKFFDDLAKGARWDVGVSIARGNPLPLDANSVFQSYADLETYAADVLAYPGQVVAVVNDDSTVIYYLDQEKAIKPVGVIPAGDGVSVDMDENDVISLHDFGKAFYKYVPATDDVAAHYERVEVNEENPWVAGLEPKVTAEGLGWYEPNPTTVDGVNSQVTALASRVTAAEADIDAIEADYLKAADKTELAETIAAEAERAAAAEKVNADAIAAIEADYLKTADKYDDTELAGRVATIEADYLKTADKYDDTEVVNRVAAIEADYLKAADIANMATDAEVETAVKAEADRAKGVEESLQAQINTILDNPDAEGAINSINEFMQYVEEHGDVAEGFRADIDKNKDDIAAEVERATAAEDELSGRLDVLEAIDHDAYKNADAALKEELNTEIAKKADATALAAAIEALESADGALIERVAGIEATLPAEGETVADVVANAMEEAAADAQSKADAALEAAIADAAGKYSTTGALVALEAAIDERLDALEAFDHDTYATKEALNEVSVVAGNAATKADNLEGRINDIVATGGEPNAINTVKVNGSVLTIAEDKSVDVIVPVKFTDLTDDSNFDARITAAQTQANKGVDDAAAVKAIADANKSTLENHTTRIETLETAKGNHEGRIIELEAADVKHAAEYEALITLVNGHTEAIAKKADVTTVDAVVAKAAANEAAIATLNETTIPMIQAEVAKKADASALNNYYTKSEVGTIADGKTLVQMITDAQDAASYDDTEVRGLIATEAARADAAEKANAAEIARVNAVLVAAIENEDDTALNSIKELAIWVEEHGEEAAEMAKVIAENTNAISAINHETTGILAQANAYADSKVGAIPVATADVLGLVKVDNNTVKMNETNQLYVAKVSTDILEQGEQILVLNGGSAND